MFSGLIQSFAKDDINEEDDTWFEQGVVRVFDPYYDVNADDIAEIPDGRTDPKTSLPSGHCVVNLKNGDALTSYFDREGLRQGRGSIDGSNMLKYGLICVQGSYKDGILMGFGRAILAEGSMWSQNKKIKLEGVFNDGYLEGPVRGVDMEDNLVFVGEYSKGLPVGACWLAKEGQGWLFGKVDERGRFTGENITFVYPDRRTSLVGSFNQEVMLKALSSRITRASLNDAHILCLVTHIEDSEASYTYSPSNSKSITCDWLLSDNYESVTVVCGASGVSGAGDGLFARRDLPSERVVAYYNGVKILPGERYSTSNFDYQIYVDWADTDHSAFVDVPPECTDSDAYHASLAHKANHSFDPNCKYVAIEHPRFGRIPALQTLRLIQKGEELFAHYKYDMALAPQWYQEAWGRSQGESFGEDDFVE